MHTKIKNFGTPDNNEVDGTFNVLIWNVHKCLSNVLEQDLKYMLRYCDIVLMQEAVISEYWEKALAYFDRFEWSFFKSFNLRKNSETWVLTGSRFDRIAQSILPTKHKEPILRTPKASGISLFPIKNSMEKLMVINTHAMNFNFWTPFMEQISEIAESIQWHIGPMIWAGDFNTWSKWRMEFLMQIAESLWLEKIDFSYDPRFLKLDHILYRGLAPITCEIFDTVKSSDHYPISAQFELIK